MFFSRTTKLKFVRLLSKHPKWQRDELWESVLKISSHNTLNSDPKYHVLMYIHKSTCMNMYTNYFTMKILPAKNICNFIVMTTPPPTLASNDPN